jgi:dihydroorotase-like cyclic amidohydrolase
MKCNPPIRDVREQSLLLIGLKKKYFDTISSGHFPVDPMYKKAGGGNFFKAFNGVSTLGFSL